MRAFPGFGVWYNDIYSMSPDVKALSERLPEAALPYPESVGDRAKYVFWKFAYPAHNHIRNLLLKADLIHPPYIWRQDYVLGTIAPGRSVEELLDHVARVGFRNHFVAWEDADEIASVRMLVGFEWQFHLRVFRDGEVRGHYELTPESHPFRHYRKEGQCARRDEFLALLGDWVVPTPVAHDA